MPPQCGSGENDSLASLPLLVLEGAPYFHRTSRELNALLRRIDAAGMVYDVFILQYFGTLSFC